MKNHLFYLLICFLTIIIISPHSFAQDKEFNPEGTWIFDNTKKQIVKTKNGLKSKRTFDKEWAFFDKIEKNKYRSKDKKSIVWTFTSENVHTSFDSASDYEWVWHRVPSDNETNNYYPDGNGKGKKIHIPNGDISFADEIIEFKRGSPKNATPDDKSRFNPNTILGPPTENRKHFTMGCRGELTLKFTDNVLVDIPGDDLYIFEVGKAKEPVVVLVSKDNKNWIFAGVSSGGTSNLDIGEYVEEGEQFFYVKLIDVGSACDGSFWDGSDMVAVAALGTVKAEVEVPSEIKNRQITYKKTLVVENDEVSVKVWDNGKEDGDIISLNVNGEWVLKNHEVKQKYEEIKISIQKGENYIILHAENLGDIEPNTAAISVNDGELEKIIILNSNMGESEGVKIVR